MPVYTPGMKREEMVRIAEANVCAECEGGLTVCSGGAFDRAHEGSFMLRCSNNWQHNGWMRIYKTSAYDIPGFNLYHFKNKEKELTQTIGPVKAHQLSKYQNTAVLSRDQAEEIVETLWPGAPRIEQAKAILLCTTRQLNPLLKHVFLIPFGEGEKRTWALVLGIKATRIMARQATPYSYLDSSPRVMTAEEGRKILGDAYDPIHFISFITKLRDMKTGAEASGVGAWPKDKTPYGTDKGNSKENMASIRSERQAMDRLCPGVLPEGVDVIDESAVELPEIQGEVKQSETVKTVDDKGEIVEGEAAEVHNEPAQEEARTFIDLDWLKESLTTLKWTGVSQYLKDKYKVTGKTVTELVGKLNEVQSVEFTAEIQSRLKLK